MTDPFFDRLETTRLTAYHLEQRDTWVLDSNLYRASYDDFIAGASPTLTPRAPSGASGVPRFAKRPRGEWKSGG